MSRRIPDDNPVTAARRKASKERLIERIRGKQALLETWEKHPKLDRKYRNDLKRRLDHHSKELIYRGG